MGQRYELATTPDQTADDAATFFFNLRRGTEKELILASLRQQKRRVRTLGEERSLLDEMIKNTEKRNDAEWSVKRVAEDYDDAVIVVAPATHVDPTPPEDIVLIEGRMAFIDFKRARIGLATSAGRVSVTYADIVQKPELTYPSVVPAVEIDFPSSVVTDTLPPFSLLD